MQSEGFNLDKTLFSDRKNFPYGFDRSGDFTTRQADTLARFGTTLQAIEAGARLPETDTERDFLAMCQGHRAAESFIETTWAKYRRLTASKSHVITAFGSQPKSHSVGGEDLADGFELDFA